MLLLPFSAFAANGVEKAKKFPTDTPITVLSPIDNTGIATGKIPKWNAVTSKWEMGDDTGGAGSGDVSSVGDCLDGACLDGTSDGGTWIKFYDAQGATQLIGGDTAGVVALTLPIATGTLFGSGGTDFVKDTHIDWGAGAGQVSIGDLPDAYEVIPFTFKPFGGGIVINTTCEKPIAYAGTITKVEIECDASSSIQIEVYKSSTASPDQRVFTKISASAPMTLTTAYQSSDSTLTGWTTAVSAGDTLQLKVTSATAGNPTVRTQAKIFITRT